MPALDLPRTYDPNAAESRWYAFWLERGYFHAPDTPRDPYCIVIPPPNVTGALHLGHALNNTIQDILIRFRRMQGKDALWMPGTDHAGIATQAVVERRLFEEEKKTRHDLGREELVRRIWAWKDEYEARILSQLRQMGCSCDWARTRFTLDEVCSRAVRRTFLNLFKAGKIFRGKRLVNWDTQLRTAVADDEIYTEEVSGHIWTIRYPVVGSDQVLHVATTRPETMLGDTAVAVHPDDPRYQLLIGKEVALPLTDRRIPIIADPLLVDPAFGTGCVKVTPAHDPNDYAAGLRNRLPMINLLNPDGTYNENAGPRYAGLDRLVVRKRVLEDLREQGLLERTDSHLVPLKHSERSKSPIEPYLSDQWFVRMGDEPDGSPGFAQRAIEAVTSGRIRIYPERYAKSYVDWLAEKRDWCISRQLWWGHRIPIWYAPDATEEQLKAAFGDRDDLAWQRSETGGWLICSERDLRGDELGPEQALIQDPDVLDTWFSSALWPHSTLGWPASTPELRGYYPTAVLSTARDIITLWVARMVIFGQFNVGDVPFRDVFIHPVIQDGEGKRMSKSAGNGIDPVDIIEAYGADALRFTLAAAATETQDLRMPVEPVRNEAGKYGLRRGFGQPIEWVSLDAWKKAPRHQRVNTSERFEQGRTFPNKFWNAARFAILNLDGYQPTPLRPADLAIEDRWILSKLDALIEDVTGHLDGFRFAEAARSLRDFTWSEFCDWYLEILKPRLRDAWRRSAAQQVLAWVLDQLCRLLHPIMPFVTEQAWQALNAVAAERGLTTHAPSAESVCVAPWPAASSGLRDPLAEAIVSQWQEKITALRNLRAERGVPDKARIAPTIVASQTVAESLRAGEAAIRSLSGAESLTIVERLDSRPDQAAVAVLPDAEIILPLSGLVDPQAERQRLRRQLGEIDRQLHALAAKLDNDGFLAHAPAEVVAQARSRREELTAQRSAVEALLASLPG
ncbi:MAG: valine--tRNA ligase [Isosphaeraceae bacterium]|jgi:valyl-tRNA synthetase|nr:MAG: valine--tRNA ligase [Isosphaeraceae bacterium]